ncbi:MULTISPECIES: chromate transporter [unclassified Sinorhizobium]|uniref:chromate transporter n=1 Tax=unclassified Sinorhizobium TaxID=2613772 RepID=UPI00352625C8
MRDDDHLIGLVSVFAPFSLISIGGGIGVLSGIQHEIVAVRGWISAQDFVQLFAISRASPGPGTMIATLIGWRVSGWMGAAVATLAFFLPSSLVCYAAFRLSNAHRQKAWHRAFRHGLAPVGTGLVISSVIAIVQLADGGPLTLMIAFSSAAAVVLLPRLPVPIVLLGGAGTALLHHLALIGSVR